MQELLNSEREYFTDLGMLQRLYVKPLTEGVKTKVRNCLMEEKLFIENQGVLFDGA
jgi:hypothetical protein